MDMPVGALVSKRDELGDGVASGVSDRGDRSGGGFGEDFDGRLPAAGGEMDGVGGKHGGVGLNRAASISIRSLSTAQGASYSRRSRSRSPRPGQVSPSP